MSEYSLVAENSGKQTHLNSFSFSLFSFRCGTKMDVIVALAQTAVEEILSESRMAILAMLQSSKLLPLLKRRLNFSQDAIRFSGSSMDVDDIKWPLICDFTVDGIVECILEYIKVKWKLSDRNDVFIKCTTTFSINNIVMYHFKVILLKALQDDIRIRLPMAGTTPIYFLVEFPLDQEESTHAVNVTYTFAGTNSIYVLSSNAQNSGALACTLNWIPMAATESVSLTISMRVRSLRERERETISLYKFDLNLSGRRRQKNLVRRKWNKSHKLFCQLEIHVDFISLIINKDFPTSNFAVSMQYFNFSFEFFFLLAVVSATSWTKLEKCKQHFGNTVDSRNSSKTEKTWEEWQKERNYIVHAVFCVLAPTGRPNARWWNWVFALYVPSFSRLRRLQRKRK